MDQQHEDVVVRLTRIEVGIEGIRAEFKRLNGTVGTDNVRIGKAEVKLAALEAMSVGQARKEDSDESDREVLRNICLGCGPDWRDKIEKKFEAIDQKIEPLNEKRWEMKGKTLALVMLGELVAAAVGVTALITWLSSRLPIRLP